MAEDIKDLFQKADWKTEKQYRLFIVVRLKLVEAKTGDIIWEEPNFTGDTEYFVTTVTSIGEQKAAVDAVHRLAYNIVDRITEDW